MIESTVRKVKYNYNTGYHYIKICQEIIKKNEK
jgi:hypothetical protein